jgi:hypothetical protein
LSLNCLRDAANSIISADERAINFLRVQPSYPADDPSTPNFRDETGGAAQRGEERSPAIKGRANQTA